MLTFLRRLFHREPNPQQLIRLLLEELVAFQQAFRQGQILEVTQYGSQPMLAPLVVTAMVSVGKWVFMPVPEYEGQQDVGRARGDGRELQALSGDQKYDADRTQTTDGDSPAPGGQ